jgi:hypothetical protein
MKQETGALVLNLQTFSPNQPLVKGDKDTGFQFGIVSPMRQSFKITKD